MGPKLCHCKEDMEAPASWCSMPPSVAFDPLKAFDAEVRECFVFSSILDLTDSAWQQAQLSLKYGGLGLRSVALHSCAASIASVCATGCAVEDNHHLPIKPFFVHGLQWYYNRVTWTQVSFVRQSGGGYLWTMDIISYMRVNGCNLFYQVLDNSFTASLRIAEMKLAQCR